MWKYWCLCALVLLASVPLPGLTRERAVLILYSYHDQLPWQKAVVASVRDALVGQPAVVVYEERLDAVRFPAVADQRRLRAAIVDKYRGLRLSAVITESEAAAQFLLDDPGAFGGAERLFVNSDLPVPLGGGTRYSSEAHYDRTLDLAAALFPRARRLVLIDAEGARTELLRDYWLRNLTDHFTFEVWNGLSIEELERRVAALSPDSVLLHGVYDRDGLGQPQVPFEVVRRLSLVSRVPGFVFFDSMLGSGAVGGYVLSAARVGQLIGDLALGRPVNAGGSAFHALLFDAQALERWKVARSRLPPGSQVMNDTEYRLTGAQLLMAGGAVSGGLVAALVVWIVALLGAIRRRKAAESVSGRLQLALDQARWGLALIDPTGTRIERVNAAYARMHRYDAEELVGVRPVTLVETRAAATYGALFDLARREGSASADLVRVRKDGTTFPSIVTVTSLGASGGRDWGFVTNVLDISDRVAAEQEKARLQAQLVQSQKLESLGSLAGGIAHDMNNVLGAILTTASSRLVVPGDSPDHKAFERIVRAAERGGKMVKSLLGITRQTPVEEREVDLNALLHDTQSLLEHTTLSRVQVKLDLEADLRPVRGDPNALTSALMNLCVNGLDAIPGTGTLVLRSRNHEDRVEIEVEDSGMGMAPDVVDKALDPFFTTKPLGKGTGLGLTLVFATVKAHRGDLRIQSEVGRGTRVTIVLPAATRQAPLEVPSAAPLPDPGQLAVLLVDDDELVRSSIESVLIALGHRVVAVASGEEALDKLSGGLKPDVVVLDMTMPGLGAEGTLPRLKEHDPVLPVLLATGKADQSALDLVARYPGVELLAKPFGLAELRRTLALTVRRRGATETSASARHPDPQTH